MKNPLPKILFILFVFVSVIFISSCEEGDPEYPVVITVKYSPDTLVAVPGALVKFKMNSKYLEGVTNASGQFTTTFDYEAILKVTAEKDTGAGPTHFYGETMIRLLPDETVRRTVFVEHI